jgi:hypothetical protein
VVLLLRYGVTLLFAETTPKLTSQFQEVASYLWYALLHTCMIGARTMRAVSSEHWELSSWEEKLFEAFE